ncbi:MAG: segregation/condensation protein A [Erysipelotrichaceae bacterium]|nr:segregation/condensation protein A [Erysipelotrichaceae bacterium]
MGFTVETMRFEGPLDLMLHLIHEKELDIFDLDMEVLTDQYIKYLHEMEKLKLEVESEYLVELAALIEYKSKKLLPKPSEDLNDEYEEDPKERLVRRLLEYQKYKEISSTLYDAYVDRQDLLAKPISYDEVVKNSNNIEDQKLEGNPYDLLKAMNKVLRRLQLSKPFETKITAKEISTEDRILQIKSRLINLPESFDFETLLDDCHSIHECIVTFLAVLVMAKDHFLIFTIDNDEKIWFKKGSEYE